MDGLALCEHVGLLAPCCLCWVQELQGCAVGGAAEANTQGQLQATGAGRSTSMVVVSKCWHMECMGNQQLMRTHEGRTCVVSVHLDMHLDTSA